MKTIVKLITMTILTLQFEIGNCQKMQNDTTEIQIIKTKVENEQYVLYSINKTTKDTISIYSFKHDVSSNKDVLDGKYYEYQKGKLIEEGILSNGVYLFIIHYNNQLIKSIYYFKDNNSIIEQTFYENGILESFGETFYGVKNRCWLYYNKSGDLEKTQCYKVIEVTKENIKELMERYNLEVIGKFISIQEN